MAPGHAVSQLSGCSQSLLGEVEGMECHQRTAAIVTRSIRRGIAMSRQMVKMVGMQTPAGGLHLVPKEVLQVQLNSS